MREEKRKCARVRERKRVSKRKEKYEGLWQSYVLFERQKFKEKNIKIFHLVLA